MIKTVKIDDDHQVKIDTSMNWLFVYKNQFGHDVLQDLIPLIDTIVGVIDDDGELDLSRLSEITSTYMIELSTLPQVFWALARNASDDVGTPEDFFKQMGTFPVDTIIPGILDPLLDSFVSEKNRERIRAILKAASDPEKKSESTTFLSRLSSAD